MEDFKNKEFYESIVDLKIETFIRPEGKFSSLGNLTRGFYTYYGQWCIFILEVEKQGNLISFKV